MFMKKKMLFIYNPKAGKGNIKSRLSDVIDVFVRSGYEVLVHSTQSKNDACEQVKAYCTQVDVIACSGGDGTLDEVVTGMMETDSSLPVCYVPSGSTNDFANSLFIPKDLVKAAELVDKGKLYGCDIGKFNNDTFAYIAAFGLFTDVAYETDQELKNILGHVAYVLEGVKRLFDIKTYELRVECEDFVVEDKFIYGMITNSRSVGGFQHLTGKNVDMDDGLFEVTLIKAPKNALELQEIIANLLSGEDHTDLIYSLKSGKIRISSNEEVSWTLDGEFGGSHCNVEIENLHKGLKIFLENREG
jgi:YegS/Rv2252/BmrU family lipid kinase